MSRLYKRGAAVTFIRPLSDAELAAPTTSPNALIVKDLRVVFNVQKSLSSDPNTCEIFIYNLDEQVRKEVQKIPLYIRVDAGFDGRLERLFTGDLRWGTSVHQDRDWETRIQVGDGDRSFRFGRVERSYKQGVSAKTAISDIVRAMGLKPKFSSVASKELNAQYASGLTICDKGHVELTRILSRFGMNWSIQDGILQILRSDEVSLDEVIIISPDTGLIGDPAFGSPPEPKKLPIINVTCLLKPTLRPGGRIQVESRSINGIFRIERVTHDGDTWGQSQQWVTQIEGRQV